MDIFLIVVGAIGLVIAFAGCFLPLLPGPPIAYFSLWLVHFTTQAHFTTGQLVLWGCLVVFVQIADYLTPVMGTRYSGGSRLGNWGCAIGTIAGLFLFAPWGILFGPFLGAFVGELMDGKQSIDALKAGFGAFIGFLLGVVLKVALCGYFIYCFIEGLT